MSNPAVRRERGIQIVSEPVNASALSAAMDTAAVHARTPTAAGYGSADAAAPGVSSIRRLVAINLGLSGLQPLSAGLFLSGYGHAVAAHTLGAFALLLGALIQAVTAIILWRQRRVSAWISRMSVALFVVVFLQIGLGYRGSYWLHVPIGVGIFGWLTRLKIRLDTRTSQLAA